MSNCTQAIHKWERIVLFAFSAVLLLALLVVSIYIPSPEPSQHDIFKILLSLGAGGFGTLISGSLTIKYSNSARAFGGAAFFFLVYINPFVLSPIGHTKPPYYGGVVAGLQEVGGFISSTVSGCTYNGGDNATKNRLRNAIVTDDFQKALLLIKKGVDVNARYDDNQTPLHYVARFIKDPEKARILTGLLIEKRADIDAKDNADKTPLHHTIENKKSVVARLLIEKGADVKAKNKHGETPLHYATASEDTEVARLLIEKGADVDAKINEESGLWTPLHYATRFNENTEVARLLIEKRANVDAKRDDYATPLHYAAISKNPGFSKLLIKKCADVKAKMRNGWTPLDVLSKENRKMSADDKRMVKSWLENPDSLCRQV